MQPDNNQPNYQTPQTPNQGVVPAQPQQVIAGSAGSAPPTEPPKQNPNSTQSALLFSEMRENMIIMQDGSFRAIVECESINFDLMSSREREGIEFSYQNFLNSLYFPIQILVRSRRVDIGPYLDRLIGIRRSQDNMLLNTLMDSYIEFIDILAQDANIMDKSFFIVVPYHPTGDINDIKRQTKGIFSSLFGGGKDAVTHIDQTTYDRAKDEIKNRIDSVVNGLFQMGVKSQQLSTKQLGELFYNSYNHDTASREPLAVGLEDLTTTFVRKGQGDSRWYYGSEEEI